MDPQPPPSPPLRVLVVDDLPDEADSLALLLTLWGHHASIARDGAGALELARATPPDVALLDLGLPGRLDGWEVARQLRARPATAAALLVAVTGHGRSDDREHCRQAGFDHFLLKPFDPADLGDLLGRYAAFLALLASGTLAVGAPRLFSP